MGRCRGREALRALADAVRHLQPGRSLPLLERAKKSGQLTNSWWCGQIGAPRLDPPEAVLLLSQSRGTGVRRRDWRSNAGPTKPAGRDQEAGQADRDQRSKAAPTQGRCRAAQAEPSPVSRQACRGVPPPPPPPSASPGSTKRSRSTSAGSRPSSGMISQAAAGLFRTVHRAVSRRARTARAGAALPEGVRARNARARPTPKTPDEWVYAATVALNSGDHDRRPRSPAARARRGPGKRSRALHHGGRARACAGASTRPSITSAGPSA